MSPPSSPVSPTYTATPWSRELHLSPKPRLRPNRQPRSFVKQTKGGNVSLRLVDQDDRVPLPVYGLGAAIQGTVDISKTEGVSSVELQVEGVLELEETAGGGTSKHTLFVNRRMLWIKDRIRDTPCPHSLQFNFILPTTYTDRDETYLLPPTYEAHLTGLPGFRARVNYSASAIVIKPNDTPNVFKSTFFRKDDGTISTPFSYAPRSRPSAALPTSLVARSSNSGFIETAQWRLYSSVIAATNSQGTQDVIVKFYIPETRTFCVRQPIPFHLSFHSDSDSLRNFAPLAPMAGLIAPKRQNTRIQLMRQTSVDVRKAIIFETKADIWRTDCIGEGAFKNAGMGSGWVAFSGDIFISNEVTCGGFRASGFSVRDYLVLAVTPPDLPKSLFKDLRIVAPIRLVTDRWNDGIAGSGPSSPPSTYSSDEFVTTPDCSFTPSPTSPK